MQRVASSRLISEKRLNTIDNRKALDEDDKMRLWFVKKDKDLLPNKTALEMHKIACLIWRMVGGAEPDEECLDEDDNLSIGLDLKARILNWSSNVALNNETA